MEKSNDIIIPLLWVFMIIILFGYLVYKTNSSDENESDHLSNHLSNSLDKLNKLNKLNKSDNSDNNLKVNSSSRIFGHNDHFNTFGFYDDDDDD